MSDAPENDLPRGSAAWWDARYRDGANPWDTGIVPPEVVALLTSGAVPPGWALDLGCGSGVSSRYLARHGFRVVGIDLAQSALRRAGMAAQYAASPAYFCLADVSDLAFLLVRATLALDIGCFHALPSDRRTAYVATLAEHLFPGAFYLLYAFEPHDDPASSELRGVGPAAIAGFAPHFVLRWAQHGWDQDRRSAWYLLERAGRNVAVLTDRRGSLG